jgi:hypothetical protein
MRADPADSSRGLCRFLLLCAAFAALLFSGRVSAEGWPPNMTEQDFEKMQRFFRAMEEGMKPSAGPAAEELMQSSPEPRDLTAGEIARIEKTLPSSFFLEKDFSGRIAVKSPVFVFPNADHMQIQVQWTQVLSAQKKNILRKPTAAEAEDDKLFQRSERITNGEYSAVLRIQKDQEAASAVGMAEVSIPLRFFRAEFDCKKPGPSKAGPHEFTLVRCENDFVELRQKTSEKTPLQADIRIYGANGRLKVSQQSTDAVFPGGRTILDLTFKDRPDTIEGRRMRFLVSGSARRVVVLLPAQAARKKMNVQAFAEPDPRALKSNKAPQNRFVQAVNLETRAAVLPEAQLQTLEPVATRSSAYFGFNEPGVLFRLPAHPGAVYAVCEFTDIELRDAAGKPVQFETAFAGYDRDKKGCHIRFQKADGEGPPAFASVRGKLNLRYPASYASYLTDGRSSISGVRVQIDGMKVTFYTAQGVSIADSDKSIRGLAASGGNLFPLFPLAYSESGSDEKGDYLVRFFWGNVEKVWFALAGDWTQTEKNFDLKAAPLLPDAERGKAQ